MSAGERELNLFGVGFLLGQLASPGARRTLELVPEPRIRKPTPCTQLARVSGCLEKGERGVYAAVGGEDVRSCLGPPPKTYSGFILAIRVTVCQEFLAGLDVN
jgi:hypothetical protein